MTEQKCNRFRNPLLYPADGRRGIGMVSSDKRYRFVITDYETLPFDTKLLSRRMKEMTYGERGSRMADVVSRSPCGRCGPWGQADSKGWRDKCSPADFALYELGAYSLPVYMELRPYMLLFDRFVDSNPHIGYLNITKANWKQWKIEKGDRDIMSIEGTVQLTDGLSASLPITDAYKPTVMPENGREQEDTLWFTIDDSDDFKERSTWGCCNFYERTSHNIRIHRVEKPQLRNQQIGPSIRYRRSRDFWFPLFAARSCGIGYGPFVGMLSSENMSDELLDHYLKRVITTDVSSFNEIV